MARVVNLNRARKQRQRAEAKRKADANARAHGRTKAEKLEARQAQQRLRDNVDGAKLDSPNGEEAPVERGSVQRQAQDAPTGGPAASCDEAPEGRRER